GGRRNRGARARRRLRSPHARPLQGVGGAETRRARDAVPRQCDRQPGAVHRPPLRSPAGALLSPTGAEDEPVKISAALLLLPLAAGPVPAQTRSPRGAASPAASPAPTVAPQTLPSQAGQVRIEAATDRKTVTLGDLITVTVRLIHPKDSKVTTFDPE